MPQSEQSQQLESQNSQKRMDPSEQPSSQAQPQSSEKKPQRSQKKAKSQPTEPKSQKSGGEQSATSSQMAPLPATLEERTMILEVIREGNPQHLYELAQKVATQKAHLLIGTQVRLGAKIIKVLREIRQETFGYVYDVNVDKIGGYMKTEPIADDQQELDRFRILKLELAILQRSEDTPKLKHFPELLGSGSTPNFKFFIIRRLGPDLHELTRRLLRGAFSFSTALRVCIQTLNALTELHTIGFIHRFIRPQAFAIGSSPHIRTVYFFDFGLPLLYRDAEVGFVRDVNQLSRMLGSIRYMSRNSHLNRELARRDDLESWLYMSLEHFDLQVLPWRKETVSATVLEKKQRLTDGKYPELYDSTSHRFHQILRYITNIKFDERPDYLHIMKLLRDIRVELKVDFDEPYDWEEKKPSSPKSKPSKSSVKAALPPPPEPPKPSPPPPKPKTKETSVEPSHEGTTDATPAPPPKPKRKTKISVKSTQKEDTAETINVGTEPQHVDLLVEVDMAEDGHNSLDKNAD